MAQPVKDLTLSTEAAWVTAVVAVAQVRPLAQKLSHAVGVAKNSFLHARGIS